MTERPDLVQQIIGAAQLAAYAVSGNLHLKQLMADIHVTHAIACEALEMQRHGIEDGAEIERDVRQLEPVLWERLYQHLAEKSL